MGKKTVCLNMIVKDESAVIARSLTALKPLVDHWVIVDTGSSDDTRRIIREVMAGVPGELHDRPWKDFGHNRSEAIALARGKADYLMFFDADDVLRVAPGFRWPELEADAYFGTFVNGDRSYHRLLLAADRLPWRYEGVLHEYPTPDRAYSQVHLPEVVVESRRDGARSLMDPREKYARDARILSDALEREPDNARYAFYLAMSHQDAEQPEQALAAFERRAAMRGWDEETWFSLLQIARLKMRLGHDDAAVTAAFLAAHQARPTRAESLGELARHCRLRGKRWALARMFAAQAMKIPLPGDRLFVERSWYAWRCLDEFAVASYWCGDYEGALAANTELLARPGLPDAQRARVLENLAFCEKKRTPRVQAAPSSAATHTVWIVSPENYAHGPVFDEIALALREGFAELGQVVRIVHDPSQIRGRALVLGASRLSWTSGIPVPPDAILFNLEQVAPGTRLFNDRYLQLLRGHEVWDYSEFNLAELARLGVARARKCGIGYSPGLTRIAPAVEMDVDVLFYGSISGRRVPILDAIAATGLRVKRLFGCYGAERDGWIARSRVVLNLHAHPVEVFEIARVSYLLANRKCVVSEPGRGSDAIEGQLQEAVAWAREAELAATCVRLCHDAAEREAIAARGFQAFSRLRQADFLREALER